MAPPLSPELPIRQATIGAAFSRSGRGLHTGRRAVATVQPAPAGTGIRFHRLGRQGSAEVSALWSEVRPAILCTALRYPDEQLLRTVEHLLAALSAFAIDNAVIQIDGEEIPILDGSAKAWCEALAGSGRTEQEVRRRYLRVLAPLEVSEGDHSLRIEPAERLILDVDVPLAHFGPLRWAGAIDAETFTRELAPARSFGRIKWALPLKLYHLVSREPVLRGGNLWSTAPIWGGRVLGGMTVPEEPARHRALDLVGDLSLAGLPILGRVTARRPGHALNHRLVSTLMATREAWEVVEAG